MSEWPTILQIAKVDFSYFFRTKWLMTVLLSLNLSDMLVVAMVYRGMMSLDYFQFFVPAVIVVGLFAAALDSGRRIWLALREGMVEYYLSLPISTEGLVLAFLLSGGLTGLVYSGSLFLVAGLLLGVKGIVNALILLPFLFILAASLAGMSATLAAIASTHGEFFYTYQQILQTILLVFSTVFYPAYLLQTYLPSFLVPIALASPLSLAADGLRSYAFQGQPMALEFPLELLAVSMPFAVLGGVFFTRVLRLVRVKGKL